MPGSSETAIHGSPITRGSIVATLPITVCSTRSSPAEVVVGPKREASRSMHIVGLAVGSDLSRSYRCLSNSCVSLELFQELLVPTLCMYAFSGSPPGKMPLPLAGRPIHLIKPLGAVGRLKTYGASGNHVH